MTDEQFVGYLDAAADRLGRHNEGRFDSMVEAVRIGTVIASDRKALSKWQQIRARRDASSRGSGLTGADLERTIGALAITHPDLVARA